MGRSVLLEVSLGLAIHTCMCPLPGMKLHCIAAQSASAVQLPLSCQAHAIDCSQVLDRPVTSVIICILGAVWLRIHSVGADYQHVGASYDLVVHGKQLWRLLTAQVSRCCA